MPVLLEADRSCRKGTIGKEDRQLRTGLALVHWTNKKVIRQSRYLHDPVLAEKTPRDLQYFVAGRPKCVARRVGGGVSGDAF
jgi:hypothetical protein